MMHLLSKKPTSVSLSKEPPKLLKPLQVRFSHHFAKKIDIVLLSPGLSVIITAIIRSRKIFQRMKNYCIYRITCTVNLLLFFSIAIIAMNFSIPTICLVILVLLNDGTIMTIAHDKVIPSKVSQLILAGNDISRNRNSGS
jgi:magnesium-transporting ATPase (P-type)